MQNTILFLLLKLFLIAIPFIRGEIVLEKVTDPVIHGEGPYWDADKQFLYYVDIASGTVNKFDPKKQTVDTVHIGGGPVSLVIPYENEENKFIIGRGLDIVSIDWDGISSEPSDLKVLASVDQDKPDNRFNDGKADASGRLWAGTMGPENPDLRPNQGSLYSFDPSNKFTTHKHVSPVSVSNGIAWNDEDNAMYYIDSPSRVISVFNFNLTNGKLSDQRVLFSLEKNNIDGYPDGMTIDRNGNLWVAVFKGSCILQIDPKKGKLLQKINFPVKQVTSCAFGGDDLQDLYVTTSKVNLNDEDLKKEPFAGSLFKVTGIKSRGQVKSNKIINKK